MTEGNLVAFCININIIGKNRLVLILKKCTKKILKRFSFLLDHNGVLDCDSIKKTWVLHPFVTEKTQPMNHHYYFYILHVKPALSEK